MKKFSISTSISTIALLGALALPASVAAQDVTLTSSDGTVNMTGRFVDFRDNSYVIATALGEMPVSASRVSCVGAACPARGGILPSV